MNNRYTVKRITRKEALEKLDGHYLRRAPQITYAFGLFDKQQNDAIVAVVTFGSPASPNIGRGLCGEEERLNVTELNRVWSDHTVTTDTVVFFLREALKQIPKEIVVSYVQPGQNMIIEVFRRLGFFYTGLTKERTDRVSYDGDNRHNRHVCYDKMNTYLVPRPRKHRFVLFNTNQSRKTELLKKLRYETYVY